MKGNRWDDVAKQKEEEEKLKAADQAEAKELPKRFGASAKRLRQARKVSQEEFADIVGVHRTHMGHIERGDGNISLHSASRVARALDLRLSQLLEEMERTEDSP